MTLKPFTMAAVFLLAGCGGSDGASPTTATVEIVVLTGEVSASASNLDWLNQTSGLVGPAADEEWRQRVIAACTAPIWELAPADQLANEFIDADGGDTGDSGVLSGARDALWIMAAQSCPAEFPPGELERDCCVEGSVRCPARVSE